MDIAQQSTSIYNIVSVIFAFLTICTLIGGLFAARKSWIKTTSDLHDGVNKLHESASDYQSKAIMALQAEMDLIRARCEDLQQQNNKQQNTIQKQQIIIQTICDALKLRDIIISIDGSMINIRDNGNSTTTRISESRVDAVMEIYDSDSHQFESIRPKDKTMGFISQVNRAPGATTSQILRKHGSILFKNPRTQIVAESDLPYIPAPAPDAEKEQKV